METSDTSSSSKSCATTRSAAARPRACTAACAKAIEAGDPAYRTIRNILAAGLEIADLPERPAGDGGAPAFLHGPDQLFGNVIHLPQHRDEAAS